MERPATTATAKVIQERAGVGEVELIMALLMALATFVSMCESEPTPEEQAERIKDLMNRKPARARRIVHRYARQNGLPPEVAEATITRLRESKLATLAQILRETE